MVNELGIWKGTESFYAEAWLSSSSLTPSSTFTSIKGPSRDPNLQGINPKIVGFGRQRTNAMVMREGGHAAPCDTPESFQKTTDLALNNANTKRKISLLGSTGSIGTQTLEIVEEKPHLYEVTALAAGSNIDLVAKQTVQFKPKVVSIQHGDSIPALQAKLEELGLPKSEQPELVYGSDGIVAAATEENADVVVTGIVGCAGLLPTVEAIKKKKTIALANKETLISGGPVIVPMLKEYGVDMVPADSEHSAIFQCLQGVPPGGLKRVILTASGGAFRDWDAKDLEKVTVADALKHPNWDMGAKITIDSATMMNKGLEVIEAHYLFGTDYDNIDIVVHPQSIIHSMVETQDTSVIAQLGWPDMRLPLLYSISWPNRIDMPWKPLDLAELGSMTFKKPDHEKYPCIELAYAAGRRGGSMTAALNAANERANEIFRKEKISYLEIPKVVEMTMNEHEKEGFVQNPSLDDIVAVDLWARDCVDRAANQLHMQLK